MPRGASWRVGFSLIELIVCIGVVLILLGMILPVIGKSWFASRQARDLAQLQQNTLVASIYLHDWKDVYPIGNDMAYFSMQDWWKPLVLAGYLGSDAEADPWGVARFQRGRFHQSMCMTYSPEFMAEGNTRASSAAMSSAVRQNDVRFPSLKGWMGQFCLDPSQPSTYFVCTNCVAGEFPLNRVAVAMADSSCSLATLNDFEWHNPEVLVVDDIGVPVFTTWGGYLARDK